MTSELNTPTAPTAATNNTQSKNMGETILKDAPNSMGTTQRTIQMPIHFIKSSHFRVIHASGAWYGADAQQNLHVSFFNERSPIPQTVVLNLNEQGAVLSEDASKRKIKEGFVREVEVDVVFSIPSAVEFYRVLGENLKALKAI
jgi:hypothetical protein